MWWWRLKREREREREEVSAKKRASLLALEQPPPPLPSKQGLRSSPPVALISRHRVRFKHRGDRSFSSLGMTRVPCPRNATVAARDDAKKNPATKRQVDRGTSIAAAAGALAARFVSLRAFLPYLLLALGRVGSGKRFSLLGLLDLGRLLVKWLKEGEERERRRKREKKREREMRGKFDVTIVDQKRLGSTRACTSSRAFSVIAGARADRMRPRDTVDVPWRRSTTRAAGSEFSCFRIVRL